MAGAPPASPAQPTDHPRRSLVRGSSRKRAVSVACPRSLWQLITSAEAVRLQHEQAQRLCRAISGRPTSTASSTTTSGTRMFTTPPLLTDDPAEHLHEIAGNTPTSGSSCSATAAAASLATAVARHTLSAGTLDTTVAPSTTPTSSSDVLLEGDFVAVTGLPGASLVEPQYVPLPIDANLEDMDTTITRKRSRPSELGSDDEGASRKVQAVGTAPHNASTTKLPPHVTGEDDRHLTLASGITTEGEFQQVLSKAQKRRQRSALPPGLAGNIPSPGTEPAVAPAARPTAPCSSPAPIAPPDVDPVVTAGVPRTSVPTSPLTSRTVLFRPAHNGAAFPPDSPNCQLWQRERRLATIKASAPTHLSHREAQAVLRATPTSSVAAASGPPRVTPTGGKTYAAALGAPDKEATTSINHPQPRLQQHVQQAGAKKRGSIKLGPSPKEAPDEAAEAVRCPPPSSSIYACLLPRCKSSSKQRTPGISFHEIPSDPELRAKWLKVISRDDWTPNTTSCYSTVCSRHFGSSDFKEGCTIRKLKKDAVPSIFEEYPAYLQAPKNREISDASAGKREAAAPAVNTPPPKRRAVESQLESPSLPLNDLPSVDVASQELSLMDCSATELPLPLENGASERCITTTVQVSSLFSVSAMDKRKWRRKERDSNARIERLKNTVDKYKQELQKLKEECYVSAFLQVVEKEKDLAASILVEQVHNFAKKKSTFAGVGPTVQFMDTVHRWLVLMDVSNCTQHIHQKNADCKQFESAGDERLIWLETSFLDYLDDLKNL
ncbi:hypothetical protein HPB49_006688 [Dermacentor silvarum]|uniref:Uncharacterized protein n=1 Tax=Dermacentor silvarum TaxID=543639 RepID=A0ACB8CVW3_DERSI|nr:hypothetical protein HPB49_006688 [Dermacentor silvarum]